MCSIVYMVLPVRLKKKKKLECILKNVRLKIVKRSKIMKASKEKSNSINIINIKNIENL